ncbi:hypothetical protein [Pseudanabaena sp. UWO310]|uniref:hypothetical protein n=1 Tax=Pseudanabaena sp. UWO310 TaxID=2480795 RepID=UPI0011589EF2|nr:hypothetical protein [Pseudanabaena sp. UWO310]TYQ29965.1 hypothetical protein PseudUWO310_11130 [Pseudanabaena sp. UWO310]
MTSFNPSTDLPTGDRACTTIEQLNAWTALILLANNPTKKFVRTAGSPSENRAQFNSGVDADNTQRMQTLCVFEEDLSLLGSSLPDWKKVKEMDSAPIPASLK